MTQIEIGDIQVEVDLKNIKNVHLSVHPPLGKVRIAAPSRMDIDTIRMFAISKLSWIKRQQQKLLSQQRESKREYLNRESHYFLGKRYLLKVIEENIKPNILIQHDTLVLKIRPGTSTEYKHFILQEWYREQLKELITMYIEKWEKVMNVKVDSFGVKRMKTRWGTCNSNKKKIWLNLELAKKPVQCLEYIVVHEMVHLLERKHNERFVTYMNKFLPQWRHLRDELNNLPVSHAEWKY